MSVAERNVAQVLREVAQELMNTIGPPVLTDVELARILRYIAHKLDPLTPAGEK